MHVAAHYGSTETIKALLRHCTDVVEMVDNNGRNAFHASVISGKANALRCLLRRVHPAPAQLLNSSDTRRLTFCACV
jgi:ankyrin repeat protein